MTTDSLVSVQEACRSNPDDPEAQRAIDLLYNTALISSGFTVSSFLNCYVLASKWKSFLLISLNFGWSLDF